MKKLLIFVLLATTVMTACSTSQKYITTQEQLMGVWYVDSVNINGDSINQSMTFNEHEIIYYEGPDGDEEWAGKIWNFDYEVDKQDIIVWAKDKSFEFTTGFNIERKKHLIIERFSFNGIQFKSLRLNKK